MSKEEQIQQLENELFIMEMKDKWTSDDYMRIKELRQQIKELEDEAE